MALNGLFYFGVEGSPFSASSIIPFASLFIVTHPYSTVKKLFDSNYK